VPAQPRRGRAAGRQRQEAERRRRIAESNFQRACALLHNAPLREQLEWLKKQAKGPGASRLEEAPEEKALALYQGLLTEPGPDPGERLLTAEVHRELGDHYMFLERRAEAAQEYKKAIALLRPLVAEFPQQAGFRDSLAHCFSYLGWADLAGGRPNEGEEAYAQAIPLYEGLRDKFRDAPWYRHQLGLCWSQLGSLRRRCGRYPQAEEPFRRALALHQQLFEEFPLGEDMQAYLIQDHNDLAWLLAIRPDRQPHHAAEALEHAQKAVAMEPGFHDWWHTLGVAHCRMGHWKEALECIEKSRQLERQVPGYRPGPPGSFDRFFESMAYSGLGDKENARRCYDEGVRWMEEHLPNHADLRRFREEAAQMLGPSNSP
jgi:tetratricopeptide (TPR) repeat protein